MSDPLTAAVVTAARQIPEASLTAGAGAIADHDRWSPAAASRLLEAVPSAGYATHVRQIADAWAALPALPGAAVAAAMRAAGAAGSEARQENRLSLVWTGPPTDEITLRSTRAVLHDLIAGSTETLILVSYASYGVAELAEDLREAAERGVRVTLILESDEDSTDHHGPIRPGKLKLAPALGALGDMLHLYRWPADLRAAIAAPTASLHAKCVIADARRALVTSANLTDAAINDNMELGVLIESPTTAPQLHRHFHQLIADGVLVRVR